MTNLPIIYRRFVEIYRSAPGRRPAVRRNRPGIVRHPAPIVRCERPRHSTDKRPIIQRNRPTIYRRFVEIYRSGPTSLLRIINNLPAMLYHDLPRRHVPPELLSEGASFRAKAGVSRRSLLAESDVSRRTRFPKPAVPRRSFRAKAGVLMRMNAVPRSIATGLGERFGGPRRDAWLQEIAILKTMLQGLDGTLFPALSKLRQQRVEGLEFNIPRMGKRIDAVVVSGATVFVIEFKVGEKHFNRADLDRALGTCVNCHT